MRENYKPYNMAGMEALMHKAYCMGWYVGKQDLLKVTMQGAFEGWSGRATETWEQHFIVEFREPSTNDKETLPARLYTAEGRTLDDACQKILQQIANEKVSA
jgi:hypothetical protein